MDSFLAGRVNLPGVKPPGGVQPFHFGGAIYSCCVTWQPEKWVSKKLRVVTTTGAHFCLGAGVVLYSVSILTIAVWQTWCLKTTRAGPDLI